MHLADRQPAHRSEHERHLLDRVERLLEEQRVAKEAADQVLNGHVDPRSAKGDHRRLRSIPVISRGVSGTIPGTDPVKALLAAERQRENGRRRRGVQ